MVQQRAGTRTKATKLRVRERGDPDGGAATRGDDDRVARRPSVLIASHDPLLRHQLLQGLASRGMTVLPPAATCGEALARCEGAPADYAVIDEKLGAVTGIQLLVDLKKQNHDIVVLMLTDGGSTSFAVRSTRAGAANVLDKPVDADRIVDEFALARQRPALRETSYESGKREMVFRALAQHDGNVTRAAEALAMDRRSVQRILRRESAKKDQPERP